jgi:hypothetical protein
MTSYRCRSRVVPCPAGDRCPQHRGLIAALEKAAVAMDFDSYADLSKQLGEQQATGRVRRNLKGETIVSFNTPIVSAKMDTREVTFQVSRPRRQQVNLGKLTAADLVDKDRRIYFDVYDAEETNRAIQETYGPEVSLQTSHEFSAQHFDELKVPAGFEGKGVQKHIVESYLAASREDLYSFGLADGILTHAEATELGFQPNPYYWAGKSHPVTGHAYPTEAELEARLRSENRADRYRHHLTGSLYAAQDSKTYPYFRTHFFNMPFELLDFNRTTDMSKEERNRLSEIAGGREEAWMKRKRVLSGWEGRKPSLRVH